MLNLATHTLPWRVQTADGSVEEITEIVAANGRTVACNEDYYPTALDVRIAPEIVKAVNCHDDLVRALQIAASYLSINGPQSSAECEFIRATLEKVKP